MTDYLRLFFNNISMGLTNENLFFIIIWGWVYTWNIIIISELHTYTSHSNTVYFIKEKLLYSPDIGLVFNMFIKASYLVAKNGDREKRIKYNVWSFLVRRKHGGKEIRCCMEYKEQEKRKARCRALSPLFIIANNVVLWVDVS